MYKSTDKIKTCLELPGELYKNLHIAIINKYGKVYGHIKESIVEAIELWLENQTKLNEDIENVK